MTRQKYKPRPYGRIAADFLIKTPYANLWAKPGMGKTSIVLTVLDILQLAGSAYFPVLVIAPLKVCELVWPAEIAKWDAFAGLKCISILGSAEEREAALLRRGDVYVINYENVPWLVSRLGKRWPFKIVVADESTKLKNYRVNKGGKRSTELAKIAAETGRWINLTGTPSPNGLKDLWGQNWFIDQGRRLGTSYTAFLKRWFTVNQYTRQTEPRPGADEEIHAILADCTMALRPEDWMDIRTPIVTDRWVELPPDAQKIYNRMEKDFFAEIDEREIEAVNAMVKSMKLIQIASGSVYDVNKVAVQVHEAKTDELESLVNELGGEPVLVVYHFKFEVAAIKKRFPKARVFNGVQDEKDWNAGKVEMMLIHPQRGGHGTNLQDGGRIMVFYTHTWDAELRLQVIERIGPTRQAQSGHDRAVLIYNLIARNTMDAQVLDRLSGKLSVQDALMAARARRREQGDDDSPLPLALVAAGFNSDNSDLA